MISVPKIRSIVEKGTGREATAAAARARQAAAARARQADAAAAKVTAARFARDPREFATAIWIRIQVLPGGEDTARR